MPPVFFYLNLTLLLIMKMNKNIFFISLVKKKSKGLFHFSIVIYVSGVMLFLHLQKLLKVELLFY